MNFRAEDGEKDKGYDAASFVEALRHRNARAHVARHDGLAKTGKRRRSLISPATVRSALYAMSQRRRKLIEEAFGWIKSVAGPAQDQAARARQGRLGLRRSRLQSRAAAEIAGAGLIARKKTNALALPFQGYWRIAEMDLWDNEALDLVQPAFLVFRGAEGEMCFIAVTAWLDVRYEARNGSPVAEFSWGGIHESAPRCGCGWAALGGGAQR